MAEQHSPAVEQDVAGGKVDDQRDGSRAEHRMGAHARNQILGGLAKGIGERRQVTRGVCSDVGQSQDENEFGTGVGDYVIASVEDFHVRLRSRRGFGKLTDDAVRRQLGHSFRRLGRRLMIHSSDATGRW
ncbi:hypothetical protein [Rhodococcus sp. 14C212]|uniref:hypothetical protein n=1 Tax=Rhodococcus sp. 14C212 TaxID=2711209 RepID=UPI00197D0286|nr:hypothetical protein [Rhodococcus sp. 14C212]